MFQTGLVSVSFRKLSPGEIIDAVKNAGLEGIEWGGDIHVPSGNTDIAKHVYKLTEEAGLKVFAYGSYYRVGFSTNIPDDFSKVLNCAILLHAPVIRVWAYNKGSAEVTESEFNRLVEESRIIADMAQPFGINISFECHGNTYTDDYNASLRLINEINRQNFSMYWQPNQLKSDEYNIDAAKALSSITTNIHTFHWDSKQRFPLSHGMEIWSQYIDCFRTPQIPHAFLLEFMHDDAVESLFDTAQTLKALLVEQEHQCKQIIRE